MVAIISCFLQVLLLHWPLTAPGNIAAAHGEAWLISGGWHSLCLSVCSVAIRDLGKGGKTGLFVLPYARKGTNKESEFCLFWYSLEGAKVCDGTCFPLEFIHSLGSSWWILCLLPRDSLFWPKATLEISILERPLGTSTALSRHSGPQGSWPGTCVLFIYEIVYGAVLTGIWAAQKHGVAWGCRRVFSQLT